ncbi:MAG: exo-alpha-sialidase [Candidatus Hydrogenedentes bacterium]|nr:exo-alpha-sialidase [Candidatus Hydrogenedentota bacterium]
MNILTTGILGILLAILLMPRAVADDLWLHPACHPLPSKELGPFVRLADGAILAVRDSRVLVSRDEGASWDSWPLLPDGPDIKVSSEGALLRTRSGVLILAFMNMNEQDWRWNSEKHDADPGTRLPTYAMRSLDDGRTWQDLHKLHDEWTGCVRDMIQTREGEVVFTSMMLLNNPGRHSVLTYVSDDEGANWTRSNIIDLGGNGHHGGATESTIEQLEDGRIWQLIRTNWDRFWEAFSEDGGRSWRVIRPSSIDASSAPGLLKRLESGRLMLVWNRLYPEGKREYPRTGGDREWSEVPACNHREELSVAFSEDDGKTWTTPVVLARQPGAWLSYPYVLEAQPGELWITTMQGDVRVMVRELDLLAK